MCSGDFETYCSFYIGSYSSIVKNQNDYAWFRRHIKCRHNESSHIESKLTNGFIHTIRCLSNLKAFKSCEPCRNVSNHMSKLTCLRTSRILITHIIYMLHIHISISALMHFRFIALNGIKFRHNENHLFGAKHDKHK